MAQSGILPIIYGIITIIIIYLVVRMFYSVEYTPGTTVIYNSPIAQKLFPNAQKLFPTWGSNKIGMYDNQPFKFGQGEFWPEKGGGFKPNKFGSTGASPTGGMRPHFDIPAETDVGWWATTVEPVRQVSLDIYDNSSNNGIGNIYVSAVGWWNA